jgi:hypothetical protein
MSKLIMESRKLDAYVRIVETLEMLGFVSAGDRDIVDDLIERISSNPENDEERGCLSTS